MSNKNIAIAGLVISAIFLAFFVYDRMKEEKVHSCNCGGGTPENPLVANAGATAATGATQPFTMT